MAKTLIPENLKGKHLYDFLAKNKTALIAEKKSMPLKYSEPFIGAPTLFTVKGGTITKIAGGSNTILEDGVIRVKIVGNTCYWIDSQKDMAIPGCYDKTVGERGNRTVHLHDHIHEIQAKVGDVHSVYAQDIALIDLGINVSGTVQCYVMESDVRKDYNEKIYQQYLNGKIDQHSIGLQYVKLGLAINDEDYKEEFATWNKYYAKVLNKDVANEGGYFWPMEEIKVFENSAVLFGSNELTPTLSISKDTEIEPPTGTPEQPSKKNRFAGIGNKL